ncbi:MAG: Com family DNA-binding transcriptional regulator [Lachnospiraceae bacterium]|nr:Com family DNA-binding transcriptional regulator [Lachnospiraceae bacterium]
MNTNMKSVMCGYCNRRLFDMGGRNNTGEISIKCPRCKKVRIIDLAHMRDKNN